VMEGGNVQVSITAQDRELRRNAGNGPQLWTGKPPQGRPTERVDDAIHPEQHLGASVRAILDAEW
jgi:hypothetical protein